MFDYIASFFGEDSFGEDSFGAKTSIPEYKNICSYNKGYLHCKLLNNVWYTMIN